MRECNCIVEVHKCWDRIDVPGCMLYNLVCGEQPPGYPCLPF